MNIATASFDLDRALLVLAEVREWLRVQLGPLPLSARDVDAFLLATVELLANAVGHAQPAATRAQISVLRGSRRIGLELSCDSASFGDLGALRRAAKSLAEDCGMASSGRGLALVLHYFPELDYRPGCTANRSAEAYIYWREIH